MSYKITTSQYTALLITSLGFVARFCPRSTTFCGNMKRCTCRGGSGTQFVANSKHEIRSCFARATCHFSQAYGYMNNDLYGGYIGYKLL